MHFGPSLFLCVLLFLCFGRRDSSVIKEEIKAFLANRRISQAVVAQVTGKSSGSPFLILGISVSKLPVWARCRCWNITWLSALQCRSVILVMIMYAFDLRPIVLHIMELPQWITFSFFYFLFFFSSCGFCWQILFYSIIIKPEVLILKWEQFSLILKLFVECGK